MAKRLRVVIPPMDLTNQTIGYWHINGPAPPIKDRRGYYVVKMWDCTCKCGVRRDVRDVELRRHASLSCGCLNREICSTHHETGTRLYEIWHGMKQRCNNPNSKDSHNYSNRGITVCDEWNHGFELFRDWALDHGYEERLTLDRIDDNGPYSPLNCRWATAREQCRNTRANHLLEFNGEKKPMIEWAEITGIGYATLARRIYSGWSVERALTEPVDHSKNKYKGVMKNGISVTES